MFSKSPLQNVLLKASFLKDLVYFLNSLGGKPYFLLNLAENCDAQVYPNRFTISFIEICELLINSYAYSSFVSFNISRKVRPSFARLFLSVDSEVCSAFAISEIFHRKVGFACIIS